MISTSILFFTLTIIIHAQQGTYALKFDGMGYYEEYVDLPDMTIGGDLTIEAWVFLDGTSNWQRIIEFASSYAERSNNIVFGFIGGSGNLFYETNNNVCVHDATAFNKSDPANMFRISAASNNYYDETFIGFNKSATAGFDLNYAGFKLWGLSDAPQLWTEAGDGRMSINQFPPPSGSLIVPLDFKTSYSGEVTFSFSGTENIDPSMPIRLEDNLNGSVTDLRQSDKYIFSHDSSNTEKRFNLIFGYPDGISASGTNDGKVWIAGKSVFINPGNLKGMEGQLEIFNLLGQTLYSASVNLDHLAIIEPSLEGMVIVRLTAGGKSCTARGYIH